MKTCSGCGLSKSEEDFSWKKKDTQRASKCKECHKEYRRKHYLNNRQKYIDKAKAWEESRGGIRASRHNTSPEKWQELVDRYDGMCWSCRQKPATHLDHDHSCCLGAYSCGKCVRGALCSTCNTGIGHLGDNIQGLQNALHYLENCLSSSAE